MMSVMSSVLILFILSNILLFPDTRDGLRKEKDDHTLMTVVRYLNGHMNLLSVRRGSVIRIR